MIDDIRSETSGNFENLLVALLTPIVNFYVKELHDAMAGIGTDEDVLIEVLCSMSNYEIHTIKHAYERRECHRRICDNIKLVFKIKLFVLFCCPSLRQKS